MKYIAALGLLLVALTIPGFNLYHHLVLPDISLNKVENHLFANTTIPFLHEEYDITLTNTISDWASTYNNVSKALREAKKGDVVTIHLAGFGGSVQEVSVLLNEMTTSRALVVTVAEGPVYSGHAYLLLAGDIVIVKPYSFVMMHASSVLDMDCTKATGLDRGQSAEDKCNQFKDAAVYQNKTVLFALHYLTPAEKVDIMNGYDLYIQADEMNRRIKYNERN